MPETCFANEQRGVNERGIGRTKIAADLGMKQSGIGFAVNLGVQIAQNISWSNKLFTYIWTSLKF